MIIYKTTNKANGKIYIGKDVKNDPSYLGSGILLRKAIQKYGKESFVKEVIEECEDQLALAEREKYWISLLNATDRKIGYNITEGGVGGDTFSNNPNKEAIRNKHRESTRKMMLARGGYLKDKERQIEACKKGNTARTANGYRHSEETKRKLSESLTGREFTEEWKNNISIATKEAMARLDQKELQAKALEGRKKAWEKRDRQRIDRIKDLIKEGKQSGEINKILGVSSPTFCRLLRIAKEELK
jgi:group I intron endonuclease